MGFLDHSTNNIIVDAVLTDEGRKALSRNDGSFQLFEFALGDDEVDYELITKYGKNIGKEKIEKNTPVLEASTSANLGLKYPLSSANNPFVYYLPTFTFTGNGVTAGILSVKKSNTSIVRMSVELQEGDFDIRLKDDYFIAEVNDLFATISNVQGVLRSGNIMVYEIEANDDGTGVQRVDFEVAIKSFSNTIQEIYKTTADSLTTYIKLTGINSGLSKILQVDINIS